MRFRVGSRWVLWLIVVLTVMVALAVGVAFDPYAAIFPAALGFFVLVGVNDARDTRFRHALRMHGFLVCFKCREDLRGVTASKCPRCGVPFSPAQLRQRWEQWNRDTLPDSTRGSGSDSASLQ